jgi:16S rRNA (guanine966-N2)-methyltransferase
MRIISGIYKGKTITPPKHFNSRPTTDFAKESLFNILNNYFEFEGIDVIDLFCGTGNISYEFLSRGCRSVCCVELNKNNVLHLKDVFSLPEIIPKVKIIQHDALKVCKNGNLDFDIIFADPPYDYPHTGALPELIFRNPSLKQGAMLIVEHSSRLHLETHEYFFRTERYGEVHFSFFKKGAVE